MNFSRAVFVKLLFFIPLIIFVTGLVGCSRKIGYVAIAPRTNPVIDKIAVPITIITSRLPDSLIVEGSDFGRLKVTSFRSSVNDGLKRAFNNSFNEVRFSESLVNSGLELHVYRLEPFWQITRIVQSENGSRNFASAIFNIQATLYNNGVEIVHLYGQDKSKLVMSMVSGRYKKVFIDGLKATIETIHEEMVNISDLRKKL